MNAPSVLVPEPVARPWGGVGLPALGLERGPHERVGEWWLPTDDFPLLVKIIDARENLSIQLHPDDERARAAGLPNGKTEAWYVLDVAPDARLLVGLADGVEAAEFLDRADAGDDVSPLLRSIRPRPGDVVFVPPGTVHAILAGVVVLEAQQVSDTTYRVFDWNRRPARALHLAEARLAVRDDPAAGVVPPSPETTDGSLRHRVRLDCPKFSLADLVATGPGRVPLGAKAEMWTARAGAARVAWPGGEAPLAPGRFLLLPRGVDAVDVFPEEPTFHAVRIREP